MLWVMLSLISSTLTTLFANTIDYLRLRNGALALTSASLW